jgi:hypothetical protein
VAKEKTKAAESPKTLRCKACGNAEQFVEIMSFESHLVDGDMNYLHVAHAEVDRYECDDCGAIVRACYALSPIPISRVSIRQTNAARCIPARVDASRS